MGVPVSKDREPNKTPINSRRNSA